MKFGKNLSHLSIPEWKSYNIDYNDLKYQIRVITQTKQTNLQPLHDSFIENFNYIHLFVITKHGELCRKLEYFEMMFNQICNSSSETNISKQIKIDEIFYHVIELSITLKNLSKYILIQKIACKKIFKKIFKYYPNQKVSKEFIAGLKHYLHKDPASLYNFDLSKLTLKLTNLANAIKLEQKKLCDLIDLGRKSRGSLFSLPSTSDIPEQYAQSTAQAITPVQQDSVTDSSKFDLTIFLKKNFNLNFLIPDDSNNLNELILNFNVYLNFENFDEESTLLSYIYLQNDDLMGEPSYIITQANQPFSIIVGFIGGLRKYSYCVLPNGIVQLFLCHLIEENEQKLKEMKLGLKKYFDERNVTPLTRATIDTILKNRLIPKLKLIFRRSRYILKKESDDNDGHSHLEDDGEASTVRKQYQDDYFITLDSDIYTTNNSEQVSLLEFNFENCDKFPFNNLAFFSNDSNLSNFEESLVTKIENSHLSNEFSTSLLKKLPYKIRQLMNNNNSLNLFKSFDFYQYMISSYFNIVPMDKYVNNHYSILLNLNLFKNFENIKNFNDQLDTENLLIKAKSNQILRHQLSLKSIEKRPLFVKNNSAYSIASTNGYSCFTNPQEDEISEERDNEDELKGDVFSIYLKDNDKCNSLLDTFILKFIKFKNKIIPAFEEGLLLDDVENNYDSINEDLSFFNRNNYNEVQLQYEIDYDNTLTYAYFSLIFISIFISGIELGVIYSILRSQSESSRFSVLNNLWLILILTIGLLLSLIFSMFSINLNLQRFNSSPFYHTIIIWTVFTVVCICSIWSIVILFEGS